MSAEEVSCASTIVAETPGWLVNGGFIPVVLGIVINFWGITFVCEEFGVPALTAFCKRYRISDAFAGSIFIGTGLSLPVFFVALAGMFVSNGAIGVGAVVGGNLFNHLVTIPCSIWISPNRTMKLDAIVFARESLIYFLSCLLLIWAIHAKSFSAALRDAFERETWTSCLSISWGGSLALVSCYVLYCLVEGYSSRVDRLLSRFFSSKDVSPVDRLPPPPLESLSVLESGECTAHPPPSLSLELVPTSETAKDSLVSPPTTTDSATTSAPPLSLDTEVELKLVVAKAQSMLDSSFDTTDGYQRMFLPPAALPDRVLFYVSLPLRAVIYWTVPDVRRPGREAHILRSMSVCVVWLGLQAYVLTWCLTLLGDWWGIHGAVMGVTVAAWASNFPAHWSSMVVARCGFGDVSCCNCLGSNVFNNLIGLGLPWLLYNLYTGGEAYAVLQDRGVVIMVLMMMAVDAAVFGMVAMARWTLTVHLMPGMGAMYIAAIAYLCYLDSSLGG